MNIPFTPALSVGLDASVVSNRVPLPGAGPGSRTIMIAEVLGTDVAYIALGDSTVVAVLPSGVPDARCYPILPRSEEPLSVGPLTTHVAAITAAGTARLIFTSGDGV